jgi:hypothetical protein
MIYNYNLEIGTLNALILETDFTVTLFIHSEPVLHGETDGSTFPKTYNFYQIQDNDYANNPGAIREALNYVVETFIGPDSTITDDEFRALPVVGDIDIAYFSLAEPTEDYPDNAE